MRGPLFNAHGIVNQFKGNVVWHLNRVVDKPIVHDFKSALLRGANQRAAHMGNNDHVERLAFRQFRQLLKDIQRRLVVLEERRKFVPKEYDSLEMVFINDVGQPLLEIIHADLKHADTLFFRKSEDIVQKSVRTGIEI